MPHQADTQTDVIEKAIPDRRVTRKIACQASLLLRFFGPQKKENTLPTPNAFSAGRIREILLSAMELLPIGVSVLKMRQFFWTIPGAFGAGFVQKVTRRPVFIPAPPVSRIQWPGSRYSLVSCQGHP